jgi:hypothetical protein
MHLTDIFAKAELRKHVFVAIEGASEGTTYNEKLRGIQANAVGTNAQHKHLNLSAFP